MTVPGFLVICLFEIIVKPLFTWCHDFFLPTLVESLVHFARCMRSVWEEDDGLVL